MVASRIAIELVISLIYCLYMLGVNLEPTSVLVGDNMAVVLNTTIPASALKKRQRMKQWLSRSLFLVFYSSYGNMYQLYMNARFLWHDNCVCPTNAYMDHKSSNFFVGCTCL